MRKISLIIIAVFIIFTFQLIFSPNIVNADFLDDTISGADQFSAKGEVKVDTGKLKTVSDGIYGILFGIGVAITVIIGGVLGIQFMMASAEDKAKVKEALVPYIIGCIVIYGSFAIWRIIVIMGNSIE